MENKKFKLKIEKRTLLLIDWANVYGWGKSLKWEVCPKRLFNFFDRPKIIDKRFYCGVDVNQEKSINFKIEMEEIGFNVISKEVKWAPVLLEKQVHFKRIVKKLFDVLDNVKNTNSELSNKLYDLTRKIKKLEDTEEENKNVSEKELKKIFELIEELDGDLKNLNIDIGNLQDSLKKPAYRRKCDFDVEITRDALNMIDDYDTLLLFSGDGDYFAITEDLIKKSKKVILVFANGHKGKEYNKIENSLFYACSVDNLENSIKK